MKTLLWIHPMVKQYNNLKLKEGVIEIPREVNSLQQIFDLVENEPYRLGLMYHQTSTKQIPFNARPKMTNPRDERKKLKASEDENASEQKKTLDASSKLIVSEESRNKYPYFSSDLIRLIENSAVKELDLLTCDMVALEQSIEGCLIRYSLDKTGNANGDSTNWIMESNNENVKEVYFKDTTGFTEVLNSPVAYYTVTDTTVTLANDIKVEYQSNKIKAVTAVTAVTTGFENISTTSATDATILFELSSNQVLDCNNKTITLTGIISSFDGLFTSSATETNNPTIKNLNVVCDDSGSITVMSMLLGGTTGNIILENVTVTASNITISGGGGLIGNSSASRQITVKNCSTDVTIGNSAGGICGSNAGVSGSCVVTNCLTTGGIGDFAGGICGSKAGWGDGSCVVTNCLTTGGIGDFAGGICGSKAGWCDGSCVVTNCLTTGGIGDFAGGICGRGAGGHWLVCSNKLLNYWGDLCVRRGDLWE